jgi:hypothetical protein
MCHHAAPSTVVPLVMREVSIISRLHRYNPKEDMLIAPHTHRHMHASARTHTHTHAHVHTHSSPPHTQVLNQQPRCRPRASP